MHQPTRGGASAHARTGRVFLPQRSGCTRRQRPRRCSSAQVSLRGTGAVTSVRTGVGLAEKEGPEAAVRVAAGPELARGAFLSAASCGSARAGAPSSAAARSTPSRCRRGRAARGAGEGWSLRHAPTTGRARLDPRRRTSLEASVAHNSTLRARATAEELWEPAHAHNAVGPGARKKQGCREGARGGPQWVIGPRRPTPAGGRGRRTHCQHAHTAHPKRSPSVAVMTSQHDAVARAGCGRLLHRVDVLEPRRAGRERVELGVAALADDCSRAGYRSHGRARMRALRFGTEPAVWGLLSVMWTA